jgi:hypothetical protein
LYFLLLEPSRFSSTATLLHHSVSQARGVFNTIHELGELMPAEVEDAKSRRGPVEETELIVAR